MNIQEAVKYSGYAEDTLRRFIKEKKFLACLPRGRKGGWQINRQTLDNFLKEKQNSSHNGWTAYPHLQQGGAK